MSIKSFEQSPFPIFKWEKAKKNKVDKTQPYKYTRIISGSAKADKFYAASDKAWGKPFKTIEKKSLGGNLYEFTFRLNKSIKEVEAQKKRRRK